MDYELLVDAQVEEGKALIAQLARDGFDVTVAFWAKVGEEGLWSLYIGSKSVDSMPFADAYRAVYAALRKVPDVTIPLSQIKPIGAHDPIAVDVIAIRDRYPARLATRYQGKTLGRLPVDEVYIYPRGAGAMGRGEVVQTVATLINRTGDLAPSLVTLRDGSQIQAVPTGIHMDAPGEVRIALQDFVSGASRSISADDVVNIL